MVGNRKFLAPKLDSFPCPAFAARAIGGEAGIGKTRLSMMAGELARQQGFKVLIGGCLDIGESTVPYAPLLEALRESVRRGHGENRLRHCPSMAPHQTGRGVDAAGQPSRRR